jgi:DNA-binding response OmpR family regulator
VLIVEDQIIIAIEIEDILGGCGCVAVGPAGTLESALRLAREEVLDAAILDVNLDGEYVFPVAEELRARGIPFIFATGYSRSMLPEEWRDVPRLGKPFKRGELEQLLGRVFEY